jgi:puromycin-sensitive aminopeptidase
VVAATDKVVLNALDLSLKEVLYTPEGGVSTPATLVAHSIEDETAILTFQPPIQPGTGSLYISFTGELNDKMKGFYRSQYTRYWADHLSSEISNAHSFSRMKFIYGTT